MLVAAAVQPLILVLVMELLAQEVLVLVATEG